MKRMSMKLLPFLVIAVVAVLPVDMGTIPESDAGLAPLPSHTQDVVSAQPLSAETSCDKSNTTLAAVEPDATNAVCRPCPIMEGCNLIFCNAKLCCYSCEGEIACLG